jgi:uncharacterized surface anchored protein
MIHGIRSLTPRRSLLGLVLALALATLAGCEGGGGGGGGNPPVANVSGTVVDATDNSITLNNLQVQLVNTANGQVVATTITANGGRFAFNNVAPGTYTLRVNAFGLGQNLGYHPDQMFGPFTVTAGGAAIQGNVNLQPTSQPAPGQNPVAWP